MQKTAYELRISDWSSDVCSSDISFPISSPSRGPTNLPMQATLFLKVAATLAMVMVQAVGLAAWLNLLRFEETYTTMIEQRLDVVLEDAHRAILVGADLGLSPSSMDGLPPTLPRTEERRV